MTCDIVNVASGELAITKDAVAGPIVNPDGTQTVVYDVVVSNSGIGVVPYDLTDTFLFGQGVVVTQATVVNVEPGDIPVNPAFDGSGTREVASATLAPGTSHRYRVTVVADVSGVTSEAALDCVLDPGEDGTGFLNRATVNPSAEDCVPIEPTAGPGPTSPPGPTTPPGTPPGAGAGAPGGRLPVTGVAIAGLIAIALALVAGGRLLVETARRRT